MNKYYVYSHSILGKVFYIGKGTGKRAWATSNRSKAWLKITEETSFEVKIIADNLSNSEACELEHNLITTNKENLVNKLSNSITHKNLLEVSKNFKYDTNSPTFLTWESPLNGKRRKGDVAGYVGKNGYAVVFYNGKPYQAHRLVWVIHNNSEIPDGYYINHKDCNPSNNDISNLECVLPVENNRKKNIHSNELSSNNKSGVNGVYRSKTCPRGTIEYFNYTATWYGLDGKFRHKSFSILKYGEELAFKLACEWREKMIAELNDQGAGYTERHGT